jgi:hypothetical protein
LSIPQRFFLQVATVDPTGRLPGRGRSDVDERPTSSRWVQQTGGRHDAIVAGEVEIIPGEEVLAQARAARG